MEGLAIKETVKSVFTAAVLVAGLNENVIVSPVAFDFGAGPKKKI